MNTSEEIWNQYRHTLRTFVRSRIQDKHDVDDLLQEIFVRLHLHLESLNDQDRLESWLFQISRNVIADFYRTRRPWLELTHEFTQTTSDTSEVNQPGLSACLRTMTEKLPEKYRSAIRYSELEGHNQVELAQLEQVSVSGAKSRVQRGRTLLRRHLDACCDIELNQHNQIIGYVQKHGSCRLC